jgi:hypothetical protein
MMRRWALGLALLLAAGCAGDDKSGGSKAYCDGNVAHYWTEANDKGPARWNVSECGSGLTCINGYCLKEPLVACQNPQMQFCSEDGQRVAYCTPAGYGRWVFDCDTAAGETCRSGFEDNEWWSSCAVLSLGTCAPQASPICQQNRALECYHGYWRTAYVCDAAKGETCQVHPQSEERGPSATCEVSH